MRFRSSTHPPLALLFLILATGRQAFAATLRTCVPGDSSLVCRLESFLDILYVAAGILAVLLIIAVFAAVRAYKRKRTDGGDAE